MLEQVFSVAAGKRALLIPYLTTGWPTPTSTPELMQALEAGGADIIELGIPFSDPSADGPVIQRANEQAIANGITLQHALDATKQYRDQGGTCPVVLMGYANPFLRYGIDKLASACSEVGVAGVLAVDWPPSSNDGLGTALAAKNIDRIVLLAPTTADARATQIGTLGSGYVYYVSVQGVTGGAKLDTQAVAAQAERLRKATSLPVAVGFGVRTPDDCAVLGQAFDAVIVGTKLLEVIQASSQPVADVQQLITSMREAL